MQEIWKDIRNYEGLYQISNNGNVKSLGRWVNCKNKGKRWQEEKILKPSVEGNGYQRVGLHENGTIKNYFVHRLVAQAFIQNPNNYPQVNHKNEIKDDNRVENLEWCDAKYNVNYGTARERGAEKISKKLINGKKSKPVLQINTKTDEIIRVFPSAMEVERQLGFSNSHISECCKGNRKTCGGFKWQYK